MEGHFFSRATQRSPGKSSLAAIISFSKNYRRRSLTQKSEMVPLLKE